MERSTSIASVLRDDAKEGVYLFRILDPTLQESARIVRISELGMWHCDLLELELFVLSSVLLRKSTDNSRTTFVAWWASAPLKCKRCEFDSRVWSNGWMICILIPVPILRISRQVNDKHKLCNNCSQTPLFVRLLTRNT